jgi:predicted unusual protein kinase regulating ubiquinone biosynthesis (AarF/ABC1/UbiB family)
MDVVVKVQRPRIGELVEADLRVLKALARMIEMIPRGELASPRAVVSDFEACIREELDFRKEASSMDEFNRIMRAHGEDLVAAPKPVHELTTTKVLVMERFHGARVDDLTRLSGDPEEKLIIGMRAWFRCMLGYGFFHGDVHAGNLMALDDGRIGFLDFGIVGRFDAARRAQVMSYLLAFASGDFRKLAQVMADMGSVDREADLDALAADLQSTYAPMVAREGAKYADMIPMMLRVATKHGMRLPREFVLVTKQMLYFDRYAKVLAPKMNLFTDPRVLLSIASAAS